MPHTVWSVAPNILGPHSDTILAIGPWPLLGAAPRRVNVHEHWMNVQQMFAFHMPKFMFMNIHAVFVHEQTLHECSVNKQGENVIEHSFLECT